MMVKYHKKKSCQKDFLAECKILISLMDLAFSFGQITLFCLDFAGKNLL